ncbi:mycofactocin system FadH/OYE family oxidoreductase 1/mycofactocin system FadH/OYE family oxidoreductase 2 [Pseudonocardia endophytica]|uniref:Mycofactocin system FadH/OYE family oxidoreductase 1/mycofactocin system FadH/OYE family oxidoreductase 2 n=1 Tax=Pseudonocardia endophytica TaxID=401976 RepID=A0A4R1HGX8_PSEEN|nr:mycofactocin system FadH/OYE family oxidoreductase 1/mycofactocin system FadH/OYE family oxidoreductase 2 [Pseudonocardia endophytica]
MLFGPHETNLGGGRSFSSRHVAYYARRAAGGAGVIVTEIASVHPSDHPYAYAPAAHSAAAGWAAIAAACRPFGTLVLAGLGHAGGQGSTAHTRTPLWGPSRVPDVVSREVPVPMERPEIDALLDGFRSAASAAVRSGLDGVEVNGGQHSLLRQFLSGLTNHREDSYGTDRALLLREVLTAVRDGLGPAPILGLRLCVDELAPWAGITPSDGIALAASVAGSVDYLVPVRGSALSVGATRPDMHTAPGFNRDVCAGVRAAVACAASIVWQGSVVDPADAAAGLLDGTADLVEMTRAQIADPDLVELVRAGTPERIRPCSLSNQGVARDPRNPVVGDEIEPRSGFETTEPDLSGVDDLSRSVIVVGGGPAGCEAARTRALRGHRVTLFERSSRLGGALRLAASLPGRGRWDVLADWWTAELDRLGVDVRTGVEFGPDDVAAARAAGTEILVATGSRPPGPLVRTDPVTVGAAATGPGISDPLAGPGATGSPPELGPAVSVVPAAEFVGAVHEAGSVNVVVGSATGRGDAAAHDVIVYDPVGDAVGAGIAEMVAAAGVTCRLVTPDAVAADRLGRTGGLADANARLERAGVERVTFSRIDSAADGVVTLIDVHTDARRNVPRALVVDCSARLPDEPRWAADLPRAGDCVAPRTVAEAVREGRRVALAHDRTGTRRVPADVTVSASDAAPAVADRRPEPVGVGDRSSGNVVRVPDGFRPPGRRGPEQAMADVGSSSGEVVRVSDDLLRPDRREPDGDEPGGGSLLHTPLRIGPRTVRNRIVFTAHLTGYATGGLPTERHAAYYAARARGGAGMVITEEHSVLPDDRPYERVIRGHDPAVVPGHRRITDAVHAHGAVVLAQLNHNGGQSSGMYSRLPVRAPSALPDPMFREVAVAMTERDVADVVAGYVRTAELCVAGGYDGVELQCSHASLLRMFLSPATNRRTDGYGGSPERRARVLVEVVDAVREAIGPDRVLGVRLGAAERIPGGLDLEEGVEHARIVEATGRVDYLSTSIGVATASLYLIEASMHTPSGYASFIPSAFRRAVSLPVLGVGRFTTPEQAASTVDGGACDLVGVARGQIADPEFAAKAADGRPVRHCVGCNQECVGRVGLNLPLGCAVDPDAGREWLMQPELSHRSRNVAVVGGGPAGLSAATALAGRGHRVTLYERGPSTGGQVALAAVAPGRSEIGAAVDDLAAACARSGVTIRTGHEVRSIDDVDPSTDAVVLATGSVSSVPHWGGPGVVPVHDVLSGTASPTGRVLVVDELGFHQATSVAELLARRGCDVEIVTPALVVGQDLGLTLDREGFRRRAHAAGIVATADRVVVAVEDRVVTLLHHPTGAHEHRRVDAVVHALSTTPCDDLWTVLRRGPIPVHRIGDCLAPRRVDAAIREGERVAVEIDAGRPASWTPCSSAT